MAKNMWMLLVFVAGALLPIQAGMNARVEKELQNPVWASIISFSIGLLLMLAFMAVTRQKLNVGAFYVSIKVLAYLRIGAALTFGLVLAGQMMVS